MRRVFAILIWLVPLGLVFAADLPSPTPLPLPSEAAALPGWLRGFLTFLNTSEGNHILCYIVTLFGATAMYVFSLYKGFQGAIDFLKRLFPNHSASFYARVDFFVVIVAGSIIGFILFSPGTPIQALCAGLGWVGAMNTVVTKAT